MTDRELRRPLRSLARTPGWGWWVVGCFFARLPVTMVAVAMVLAGRRLGSFSLGAALAGVASLSSGFGAWWRARAMDRNELRGSIARDLAFTAVGLAVVAALVQVRGPVLAVGVAVALASIASSALFAGYRSMLAMLVPPALLPSSFAIDAVLVEVAFVCGPAFAGLLSLAVGPAGVLFTMSMAAVVALVGTRRLPRREPIIQDPGTEPAPAPWADAQVMANYLATAAVGMMLGLFEAGLAPYAVLLGHRDGVGGLLSAAYAFGSGAGGLVFATRLAGRDGHSRRAIALMAVLGILLVPVAGAPALPALLGMLLVAGLPFATTNAAGSSHLQARLHPARATEGFALSTMFILVGIAAGNALASLILHVGWSPRFIYLVAGVPPVLAAGAIGAWAVSRSADAIGSATIHSGNGPRR